jgi:hypothetical protein
VTLEELYAQFRFQPGDVLADGRLRAPQLPRQGAQVSGLAGGDQDSKVFECHGTI